MNKISFFIFLFSSFYIQAQDYEFKINAKITGKDILVLGSTIIVNKANSEVSYEQDFGPYYGSGTLNLPITGSDENNSLITVNFEMKNSFGKTGSLVVNTENNRLLFTEPNLDGSPSRKAIYTVETKRIYPKGDKLPLLGEYIVYNPNPFCDIIGIENNSLVNFKSNSISYRHFKSNKAIDFELLNVTNNGEDANGIIVKDKTKLGVFSIIVNPVANNLSGSKMSLDLIAFEANKVTFNFKMSPNEIESRERRKREEERRKREEERRKREEERRKREEKEKINKLKEKINSALVLNNVEDAISLHNLNPNDSKNNFNNIQSHAIVTEKEIPVNNNELIKLLRKNSEKIKLIASEYNLSSNINEGLVIVNKKTNDKTVINKKPLFKNINGFKRPCKFTKEFTVNKVSSFYGLELSKDYESNMVHPSYGNLNFFYAKNKKDEAVILCGYEQVGAPSEKKYHSIIKVDEFEFSNDYNGKKGRIIIKEKYLIHNSLIKSSSIIKPTILKTKTFI